MFPPSGSQVIGLASAMDHNLGMGSPLSNVRLRRAEPTDNDAVATVHVRSWQAAYRGLLPDAYLDGLNASDRADRYTFGTMGPDSTSTTVAVDGRVICGGWIPDGQQRVEEVHGIAVDELRYRRALP